MRFQLQKGLTFIELRERSQCIQLLWLSHNAFTSKIVLLLSHNLLIWDCFAVLIDGGGKYKIKYHCVVLKTQFGNKWLLSPVTYTEISSIKLLLHVVFTTRTWIFVLWMLNIAILELQNERMIQISFFIYASHSSKDVSRFQGRFY